MSTNEYQQAESSIQQMLTGGPESSCPISPAEGGLDEFDQCAARLAALFYRWQYTQAAVQRIHDTLNGTQMPPIISMPVSVGGVYEQYEIDLLSIARHVDLQPFLTALHNYLVGEYQRCLTNIAECAADATCLMASAAEAAETPVAAAAESTAVPTQSTSQPESAPGRPTEPTVSL